MGPIKAQFLGEATYTLDDSKKSGSVVGGGRDSLSNSRASGELQFRMSSGQLNSTLLEIDLAFALQGMLAQFSRPALVNDFASFIIEQFSENLSHRLQNPGGISEASASSFNFGRLLRWQAVQLWRRLLRKPPRL
jgi:aerobic carbon-monoxide dehydrogenase small subunit